ncbi:MAG: cyclic nucleotide-binding domain-containing protein [Chloroflexi bacterium]|nr:cyclic nucleotide-binding domain-containing protein [Chloroflexota bacterium]
MAAELHLFDNALGTETYAAGQVIFRQGEHGHVMYVVQDGEVDIVYLDTVLETVGSGGIIGEMALIDYSPRNASAIARTSVRLLPINEKRFHYMVQETPDFALNVMRIMAQRLRRMDRLSYPLMHFSSSEDMLG